MKLPTLFRRERGKRARKGTASPQLVPTPLAAVQELTQQELAQIQGGAGEIVITKHTDTASAKL